MSFTRAKSKARHNLPPHMINRLESYSEGLLAFIIWDVHDTSHFGAIFYDREGQHLETHQLHADVLDFEL